MDYLNEDEMLSQSPKTFARSAYGRGRTKRPCFVRFRSVSCEEFGDDVLSFATYYAIARTFSIGSTDVVKQQLPGLAGCC